MIKHVIGLFGVFFVICLEVDAQQLSVDFNSTLNADFGKISIYDPAKYSGRSFSTIGYSDIAGSPFLDEHWNNGILYARNGQTYTFENIRINLYSGELHYLDATGTELAIEPDRIEKVFIFNKKNPTLPAEVFVSLPDFVDGKKAALYKIFNNGKYQLLLLKKEYVKTDPYDPKLGKAISSFYQKSYSAFYNEGRILPIKNLNQSEIEKVLQLDSNTLTWIKQNKNKLRSEHDVVEFLNFFNRTQ